MPLLKSSSCLYHTLNTWKQQINHGAIKLNEANGMLSKSKHVLDKTALKSVYYAILESHLCHASLVWAHTLIQSKEYIYYRKNPSG